MTADVLVNNAGMICPRALESLPLEEWNALPAVNLTGYFVCSQIFGRAMRERRSGVLVHVASIAADHATPLSGVSSVAKAGVTMLSQQLALEWGPLGIRSYAIHPGMIYTPLSQAMCDLPGVMERRTGAIPSRHISQPDDIAQAVVFLASDRASDINGSELTVDGNFVRNLMGLIPRVGYDPSSD